MNEAGRITISALVAGPLVQVWDIWTDPEHITQWNAANDDWHCPKAENDLRIGGKFSSIMAARDGSFSFDFTGVYDKVEAHKCIAYTMSDGRACEILFEAVNGATMVTESFDAESQNPLEMQRAGWQAILDRFKAYVEARN